MSGHLFLPTAVGGPGAGSGGVPGLLEELLFAVESYPEHVSIVLARNFLVGTRRGRGGAPGEISLRVDDEIVLSLKGPESRQRWKVAMVAIRQEAVERAKSPIILPGEGGAR